VGSDRGFGRQLRRLLEQGIRFSQVQLPAIGVDDATL
jgi:hypothetical protein